MIRGQLTTMRVHGCITFCTAASAMPLSTTAAFAKYTNCNGTCLVLCPPRTLTMENFRTLTMPGLQGCRGHKGMALAQALHVARRRLVCAWARQLNTAVTNRSLPSLQLLARKGAGMSRHRLHGWRCHRRVNRNRFHRKKRRSDCSSVVATSGGPPSLRSP